MSPFILLAVMEDLYNFVHPVTKRHSPMISKETYDIIMKNAEVRERQIVHPLFLVKCGMV